MFGYVIPNQAALDDEAKARYRTAYCGLCRRIGALHGLRGRLTLSYDLTFLDLLLSSLYEGESECVTGSGHCPIHPIRKINWRHSGPTDYCADMSVALHYYNAADKWNDDHSLLGLGFEKLLDSPAQTAAQRWPRQCNAIRTCLDSSRAADDTFFLNFTSTSGSGAVGHPKGYAKDINLDLYAYEWEAGKAYGVVIVDFGPKKIAEKIYGTNFQ